VLEEIRVDEEEPLVGEEATDETFRLKLMTLSSQAISQEGLEITSNGGLRVELRRARPSGSS
jgi:hypothetical protein